MPSILWSGGKGVIQVDTTPCPIIEERPLFYYAGLKAGTLGVGVDFSIPLSQLFSLRLNVNGLKLNIDTSKDGVDYNSDIELLTAGAMIDYYPFYDGSFHITAGGYYYANSVRSHGTPDIGNYTIAKYNICYALNTSSELGFVDVTIDFPEFAPYIGIGYGGREISKGWNWGIDIGVMYHGEGDLTLTENSIDILEVDRAREEKNMQDDVRDIPIYPVVMIGITYRF